LWPVPTCCNTAELFAVNQQDKFLWVDRSNNINGCKGPIFPRRRFSGPREAHTPSSGETCDGKEQLGGIFGISGSGIISRNISESPRNRRGSGISKRSAATAASTINLLGVYPEYRMESGKSGNSQKSPTPRWTLVRISQEGRGVATHERSSFYACWKNLPAGVSQLQVRKWPERAGAQFLWRAWAQKRPERAGGLWGRC